MRSFSMVALAVVMGITVSGCGRQCKKARVNIIKPSEAVMAYLGTNPDGQTLALAGCPMILDAFKNIPQGANDVRAVAQNRFTHVTSYCDRWATSFSYHCTRPHYRDHGNHGHPGHPGYYGGYPNCYSRPHVYCAHWHYDTQREPGYTVAMQLAANLDNLYNKTHQMCGTALSGDYYNGYNQSRELLQFMLTQVKPDGDRLYSMACR